jgi:hypothetical protein
MGKIGIFFLILSGLCDAIWNIYLTKSKGAFAR